MRVLAAALLSALPLAAQGENRLWMADVELVGPFERVEFDCGEDGRTVFHGPFLAGERSTVRIPLPVRSPLGSASLRTVPLPDVEVFGGPGEASPVAWSESQPADAWAGVSPGLRARPRPPVEVARGRAPWSALLLVGGVFALGFGLRRRAALVAAVGCAGALALPWLVAAPEEGEAIALRDGDVGDASWLSVTAAAGRLPFRDLEDLIRVECEPEGAPLRFERDAAGWRVELEGGALHVIRRTPGRGDLASGRWTGAFGVVWTRDAAGAWSHRGPWAGGPSFPDPIAGPDPPGWLRAGLPPGRTVLLGRTPAGTWTRVTGVELP